MTRVQIALFTAVLALAPHLAAASGEGIRPQGRQTTPFQLRVELTASGATLTSQQGVRWKTASWACGQEGPCRFYVDRRGVSGAAEDAQTDGFALRVDLTRTAGAELRADLTSVRGTAWKGLAYWCGGADPCRFTLDEHGVHGLPAGR